MTKEFIDDAEAAIPRLWHRLSIIRKIVAIIGIVSAIAGLIGFGIQMWQLLDDSRQRNKFDRIFERDHLSRVHDTLISHAWADTDDLKQYRVSSNWLIDAATKLPDMLSRAKGITVAQAEKIVKDWQRHSSNVNNFWENIANCLRSEECKVGTRYGLRACQQAESQIRHFRTIARSVSQFDQIGILNRPEDPRFKHVKYVVSACLKDEEVGPRLRMDAEDRKAQLIRRGRSVWEQIQREPSVSAMRSFLRVYAEVANDIVPKDVRTNVFNQIVKEHQAKFDTDFCAITQDIIQRLHERADMGDRGDEFPLRTSCRAVNKLTYKCIWHDLVPDWTLSRSGRRWQGNEKEATNHVVQVVRSCLIERAKFTEQLYKRDQKRQLGGYDCVRSSARYHSDGPGMGFVVETCGVITHLSLFVDTRDANLTPPYEWQTCFSREDKEQCFHTKITHQCGPINSRSALLCRERENRFLQQSIVACVKNNMQPSASTFNSWEYVYGVGQGLSGAQFYIRGGDIDTRLQIELVSANFNSPYISLTIRPTLYDFRHEEHKRIAYLDGARFRPADRPSDTSFETAHAADQLLRSRQLRFDYVSRNTTVANLVIDTSPLRNMYNDLTKAMANCGYEKIGEE